MNELMNYIDAIKQKITDAEYKQLCDKMMELNTQRKTIEKFYRVWYVNVRTSVIEGDCDTTEAVTIFHPEILNKIIKLNAETVEVFTRSIDKLGYCFMDKKLLELEEGQASLPVISQDGVRYIDPRNNYEITVTRIEDIE